MEESIVKVKNVSRIYEKGAGRTAALNRISFEIHRGEFVGIVGDSGSGKTTLLNLIGGMDSVSEGSIIVAGRNIAVFDEKQKTLYRRNHVGFIFQDYNLIQELTVYENIILPLQLKKAEINEELIDSYLKKLKLEEKKNSFPTQLSGGEQQRTAILRALISNPDLILADEPTGNLDSGNTLEVVRLLKYFANELGRTILFVTHNQELAEMCDRIIRVKDGRISQETDNEGCSFY